MCFNPLAILGGVSGVAQSIGARKQEHAMLNAFNAERARQQGLTDQQTGLFQDSLAKAQAVADPAAMAKAASDRGSTLASAIVPNDTSASYLPGSSSAPALVATAKDTAAAHSGAVSAGLAHALGALGGTTDQMQTAGIGIGRNAGRIGQFGSFKRGSAGVLDSEMTAASHKGEVWSGIGDALQQIGMAALKAGAGA